MGVIAHRQVFMAATTLTYIQLNCSLPLTTSTLPGCHITSDLLSYISESGWQDHWVTILSNITLTNIIMLVNVLLESIIIRMSYVVWNDFIIRTYVHSCVVLVLHELF